MCKRNIYILFATVFISCELEDKIGRYTSGDNPVEVELMTRNVTLGGSESGVTLKRLRVIAVAKNSGKVEMNRRADLSDPSSSGLEHTGECLNSIFVRVITICL